MPKVSPELSGGGERERRGLPGDRLGGCSRRGAAAASRPRTWLRAGRTARAPAAGSSLPPPRAGCGWGVSPLPPPMGRGCREQQNRGVSSPAGGLPAARSLRPVHPDESSSVTGGISFQGARDYGKVINVALRHPPLHPAACTEMIASSVPALLHFAQPSVAASETEEGGMLIRRFATASGGRWARGLPARPPARGHLPRGQPHPPAAARGAASPSKSELIWMIA